MQKQHTSNLYPTPFGADQSESTGVYYVVKMGILRGKKVTSDRWNILLVLSNAIDAVLDLRLTCGGAGYGLGQKVTWNLAYTPISVEPFG